MPPSTELEIRKALKEHALRSAEEGDCRLVEDFWVPSINVRADVVRIASELHAQEIKSDADTLRRLDGQVRGFGTLFDSCSLVVAPRHAERASELVPDWWE